MLQLLCQQAPYLMPNDQCYMVNCILSALKNFCCCFKCNYKLALDMMLIHFYTLPIIYNTVTNIPPQKIQTISILNMHHYIYRPIDKLHLLHISTPFLMLKPVWGTHENIPNHAKIV